MQHEDVWAGDKGDGGGRRAREMEAPIHLHATTLHLAIVIETTIIQLNKTKLKNSIFLP